jgi:hypothetical protein
MTIQFVELLQQTGGTRWPLTGRIEPAGRNRDGYVDFSLSPREAKALIKMIWVPVVERRARLATALMDEILRRHPRVRRLVLPELLPDGRRFFSWYRRERGLL